ncbi:hypothetical protein TWF569_011787 [Orbilia oligospora]|uniref:Uncharacterized protein n=1 Tax=Orbilia oligospora TaxID=2813651 RepID=A0A7C8NE54_ORBOL|nr:hypothetical protein TWF706_009781 [Orbilia oligospora]KAF3102766.1 hypothetical protein TWF102_004423 [Orbilia oligospora]KAF3110381.1 hypothetical protein TWF103_004666 [Orbilia oligospora]KAF3122707.1 hypothetical protein TWF594_002753 [Orbilia oligospora]KAF3127425.1 hypothetical protein TWF569_011787 [Orbilia oligospora]
MCLVKVRGEVEDDVIVPARVVERESVRGSHQHQHYQQHSQQRETQIVSTAPAVIERPARSHRYSSSSSSNASSTNSITSSRSSMGYAGARHERRSRRYQQQHHAATASSYDGRSYDGRSYDGRSTAGRSSSRSRERGYYREQGRVVSGGSYDRRGSYRYVDPQPRGSNHEVRAEIQRAEEHLQRAAELQEREKRMRETRAITYDPRSSSVSHRSYEHSKDGSRRRSDVVVVQETERHRDRFTSR